MLKANNNSNKNTQKDLIKSTFEKKKQQQNVTKTFLISLYHLFVESPFQERQGEGGKPPRLFI